MVLTWALFLCEPLWSLGALTMLIGLSMAVTGLVKSKGRSIAAWAAIALFAAFGGLIVWLKATN
jgi:hypothetical protein